MRAAVIHEPGGPEVLGLETVPVPTPLVGEVLIRVKGRSALEDETVVAAQDRSRSCRSQRAEAPDARLLQRLLRLFGPSSQRELVPDHFPVVTVDHRRQVRASRLGRTGCGSRPSPSAGRCAQPG